MLSLLIFYNLSFSFINAISELFSYEFAVNGFDRGEYCSTGLFGRC